MKKLILLLITVALLSGCSFGVEEEESFEDFVENEMNFAQSMSTTSDTGTPHIKVKAEEGYLVGGYAVDTDELVIVKSDEKTNYLLALTVIDEGIKEEYFKNIQADEDGSYLMKWDNSASKLIPLSEGFYCEVYAEKASNMEALDHITIEEIEPEEDSGVERKPGEVNNPRRSP